MLKFRDLEFDFDIFDEDCAAAYEAALEAMRRDDMQKKTNDGLADCIRHQCNAVFQFFDAIFGPETHKEIFGTRVNLNECLDAFTELIDLVKEQKVALDARLEQMRGVNVQNRATRRAMKQ